MSLPGKAWARSIQPKFPEISVQNSMDRIGPTGKVSKKQVHLLRWSSFLGRTGLNVGWMDRAPCLVPSLRTAPELFGEFSIDDIPVSIRGVFKSKDVHPVQQFIVTGCVRNMLSKSASDPGDKTVHPKRVYSATGSPMAPVRCASRVCRYPPFLPPSDAGTGGSFPRSWSFL